MSWYPGKRGESGEYLVGAADRATVEVLDNELPLVSVIPVSTTVTEGTSAMFRIIRTGSDVAGLSVEYKVSGHFKIMSSGDPYKCN